MEDDSIDDNHNQNLNFGVELEKETNFKDFIISLFHKPLYAELFFAWCKDCSETITIENAKYFREELVLRGNRDNKSFNFKGMRVSKNFLVAFIGNLPSGKISKLNLCDNLLNDLCMHSIKNLISTKKLVYLNLASNMISTEGLKIIQNDVISSLSLKYLDFGIIENSFRRNNLSGEGGLILARMLLVNESLTALVLQDNELGEDAGEKIGSALIQNKTLESLKLSENKIKNKGAKSILENGEKLLSINLSNDLRVLLEKSKKIQDLNWDGNVIGLKGIKLLVEGIELSRALKALSIKDTGIGDAGVKLLAEGLTKNRCLETLDISSNSITFEGFCHICDALNFCRINKLKAKNNLLGDDSMKYFSEVILGESNNNSKGPKSRLTYFDFSSCKIYDQGLIYLFNQLKFNSEITKIKLRDNYFSHEVDFVILDFLEKNTSINSLDVAKCRLSFQCMQKVQKMIDRNIKMQNDKKPNELLTKLYSLKYENTKLDDMKNTLKLLEEDVEKVKLGRTELREDYENHKKKCEDDIAKSKEVLQRFDYSTNLKENEYNQKKELLLKKTEESNTTIEILDQKRIEMKIKKEALQHENIEQKFILDNLENYYIKILEENTDKVMENHKKTTELDKQARVLMEELRNLDKLLEEKRNANPENQ